MAAVLELGHSFHRRSSSKGYPLFIISKHSATKFNSQSSLFPLNKQSPCHQLSKSINATDEITALTSADPDITWQIVIGSLAGVTPFVVAGIEFSKRIVKQRKCEVCGGSGLVLKNKFYKRCPSCGGFLPWQSWRRFFTG